MVSEKKLFVFLNPKAGLTKADVLEKKILDWGQSNHWNVTIHETSIGEDFLPIVKHAVSNGFDVIAAACDDDATGVTALWNFSVKRGIDFNGDTC